MKKSRFWQAIHCSKAQKASQKTPIESGKHPGMPPAVPLPGPNVTPEPNEKIKVLAGNSTVSGAETKPQDTLQIRKTPWHGVTEQPPAVPLHRIKKSKFWQAIPLFQGTNQAARHPSNQENTLARRDETASCPEPNEKIKGLAGNFPGTQNKPQDTLQIRKTPWHGVTKQPPAVLCPGQTSLLNRMKKSRVWQAIVPGTQNKPQDTLQIRKTPWHGVTKQPPAIPLPGPNVTPEPNEEIKGLAGTSTVPGTETKPQDTLQIRKTPGTA